MNSEQFKRLCQAEENVGLGAFTLVYREDLRALIDDKLSAYEHIKHLESRIAQIDNPPSPEIGGN